MSYPAMAWARTIKTGSATAELAVLLVLANSADQDGNLAISRQKLADRTRMQADKLDRVIRDLEEGGFIGIFDPHDWSKIGICLKVNGQ